MGKLWVIAFIVFVHAASQALMLHGASTVSDAVAAAAATAVKNRDNKPCAENVTAQNRLDRSP